MATITSAGSGLWSAGATWVGGVAPVDNDTVIIAFGHVVEFDADLSGFADGIAGITVTGTLALTRTPGTYYLKIKAGATIGGAGTFDCGTSGSIIPFAAKHTITGGSGWYINGAGGLGMSVFSAEPVIKTVRLTQAEPIGATVLHVDTDVTGDTYWADGDTIRIDNVNKGMQSEERVIAAGGRAAGAITITAGLTAAKIAGTLVHLITRNVKFIGVGTSGYVAQNFASGKLTIAGGQWITAAYRVFSGCTGTAISAGTFTGQACCFISCVDLLISGGVYSGNSIIFQNCGGNITGGSYTGNGSVFYACFGMTASGVIANGNTSILNGCTGCTILSGTYFGNGQVLSSSAASYIYGGVFQNNSHFSINSYSILKNITTVANTDDFYTSAFVAFNSSLGSSTENKQYSLLSREAYSESIDHDQVAGAYKAWTKGGVTSSQAVTVPTGYTTAMATVLENAAVEGYWQKEYTVGAGASIQFTMNLRKAASMTYLPRCIIFNKAAADPFAGGAGLHTFTMTNSVDTWESESWTYTNSTAADVTLVIRTQGMAASGSVYSLIDVEQINVDLTSALAKLTAIQAKTDNLPTDPADESALEAAIAAITVDNAAIAAAVMGSTVEGTLTTTQALRLMLAVLAGKASGGGTTTVTFRDTADSKDRVTATVDSNGNRSAVVLDGA